VAVRRAGERVGVLARHDLPRRLVALLEGEALAVRPVAQQRRELAAHVRAEDIRAQLQPVVHADRYVPVDLHALNFGGGEKFPLTRISSLQSESNLGSLQRGPTTCTPIGSPVRDFVIGSTTTGLPVRLNAQV